MSDPAGSPPTGLSTAPSLAARVKAAREAARERLRAGMGGAELARRLTEDFEVPVVEFIASRLRAAGFSNRPGAGLVVVATGGFGRREFAPYSDLDLVFLCETEPDQRVTELAQAILNPLWDARLDAGHAVRSLDEALELPATDLMSATAMLEARYLVGDEALLAEFLQRYERRLGGPEGLVRRLRADQQARHSKFGDTIYLLEPDIKSGPGGLRDLCMGRWAARARFGTGTPAELVAMGQMLRPQAEAFERARDWLLRVRIAAHLSAGRKLDHLRFDLQEQIAPLLYGDVREAPGRVRPAVAPAVEALMGEYQIHARNVVRETERLMLRAVADLEREPTNFPVVLERAGRGVDPSLVLRDGALEVLGPQVFEHRPSEMVRLFAASIEAGKPVGLRTSDWIMEICAEQPGLLHGDPEAARWLLHVLCDAHDAATPSRLEQMQDLGLLASILPEWIPVTGRVQYDLYHVYTVDQHSLYSVGVLKALARRDLIDSYPLQAEHMSQVADPRALYVAMLLHDIGKPLGPNHPRNGATLAGAIARRLGLTEDEAARVEFLVREHLTLAHVSQRRDLSDPATIAAIADLVRDEDTLRQLYLLTFSDLYCIGPGNLTPWKEDLLRELYLRALAYVRHGPSAVDADVRERVRKRREEALFLLSRDTPSAEVEPVLDSLPERYFIENPVPRVVAHVSLIRARRGPCAVEFVHHPRRGYTELTVVADDVPGLLATVTGVLFANRVDILEAAIYSRARPDRGFEAVDVFRIRRNHHGAVTDEDRLDSIRADLEATLSGVRPVAELVAARPRTSSMFERAKPKVPPTEVTLNNSFSPDFTIIDVFTEDRPGVLYTIARVLHEEGLDIRRAKVAVEADRVADIFYVRDRDDARPVRDPERLRAIEEGLLRALAPDAGRKA